MRAASHVGRTGGGWPCPRLGGPARWASSKILRLEQWAREFPRGNQRARTARLDSDGTQPFRHSFGAGVATSVTGPHRVADCSSRGTSIAQASPLNQLELLLGPHQPGAVLLLGDEVPGRLGHLGRGVPPSPLPCRRPKANGVSLSRPLTGQEGGAGLDSRSRHPRGGLAPIDLVHIVHRSPGAESPRTLASRSWEEQLEQVQPQ